MLFSGEALNLVKNSDGTAELIIDLQAESVNKLNALMLSELAQVVEILKSSKGICGLLIRSAKRYFIVGADIGEFSELFSADVEIVTAAVRKTHATLNDLEDLPFPTVTAINGLALGGGFELCMATDYRVLAENAMVGQPEVSLGIFPGYGGTVRLPRLIGPENAAEWISRGRSQTSKTALACRAVDAVVAEEQLLQSAGDILKKCISGELDYHTRRQVKRQPLQLSEDDCALAFIVAKSSIRPQPGNPAPQRAVAVMEQSACMEREAAQQLEISEGIKLAKTPAVESLIGVFLHRRAVDSKAARLAQGVEPVGRSAVLGAGIMGGGIAYQSGLKNILVIVKDIDPKGLDAALSKARDLALAQVKKQRISATEMADILNRIRPTLSYDEFDTVDIVVEAVAEKEAIKKQVLVECEAKINPGAVLVSNTSTISISSLSESLLHPEKFCGMHFFNPVDRMPLVEVIRGEKTSDETIARTVSFALALGKKPIVVNDCPGFLVNRILFPYFNAFASLLREGVRFEQIDNALSNFGWPMGPAMLLDVVGIDVIVHAGSVMADRFPDRMKPNFRTAFQVLFEAGRYGQKNGKGFYSWITDRRGRLRNSVDDDIYQLLKLVIGPEKTLEPEVLVERMMIPMCIEAARCLEDSIVGSAAEVDMGMVYGTGFPSAHGGPLRYVDEIGVAQFCTRADAYAEQGVQYQPPQIMRDLAQAGRNFFAS